jgi:hypothetical protein
MMVMSINILANEAAKLPLPSFKTIYATTNTTPDIPSHSWDDASRSVSRLSTGILWGTSVGGDFVPVTQYHWLAL